MDDTLIESGLCEGCPPTGYPTDEMRCLPCPRRTADTLIPDFAEWSDATVAAQCRMQASESIDPEYSQFMNAVADRIDELAALRAKEPRS